MREARGVRQSGAACLLGFSLLVSSLASACSDAGEQRNVTPGVAGSASTTGSGVIGQPPAGAGGSPMASPGVQPPGGDVSPLPGSSAGGVGGAPTSADAGAQGGATAPADAGVAGTDGTSGVCGSGPSGAGAIPDDAGMLSVCTGGKVGMDSDSAPAAPLTVSREYAAVKYQAAVPNQILSLKTTMLVPKTPSSRQTLFIWPGLQSKMGAADPARIGNGVLQPVLTWGGSCAPSAPRDVYGGWWISGMYVNVTTGAAGPTGCAGGDFLSTEVGDLLEIDMSVNGTAWTQTMTDLRTMESVDFTIDLEGQVQNNAMWIIEVPSGETIKPSEDVVFTQSVLTFSSPVTSCQPSQAGKTDYFSAPVLSPDGLHCCYDKIILRAQR